MCRCLLPFSDVPSMGKIKDIRPSIPPARETAERTEKSMDRNIQTDGENGHLSVPHVSVRFGPKRRVGRDKGSGVFVRRAAKVADESEGSCRTRIPCVPRRGVGSPSEGRSPGCGRRSPPHHFVATSSFGPTGQPFVFFASLKKK